MTSFEFPNRLTLFNFIFLFLEEACNAPYEIISGVGCIHRTVEKFLFDDWPVGCLGKGSPFSPATLTIFENLRQNLLHEEEGTNQRQTLNI